MSRDLLRRKKRRFLKAGGMNPPVDLSDTILVNKGGNIETAFSSDTAAGPETDASTDGITGTEAENNGYADEQKEDYFDLVFAEFLAPQPVPVEIVPRFIRRGKKAAVMLLCVLLSLTFAYNAGYIDVLQTEVDSFVTGTVQTTEQEPDEHVMPEYLGGVVEESRNGVLTLFLTCDGETVEYTIQKESVTVEGLLEFAGVTLSDEDTVEPGMYQSLEDRDSVTVTRIRHSEYTVRETIPASTDIKLTPLLYDGRQRELYAYQKEDGEKELTYRDEYINGEMTKHELIGETVITSPVNSLTLEGASVSMSAINGARFTDIMISGNAPESYISCITGYCTAYNFDEGVWGASGMYLSQGFVAVDPSVIPYGSLLYITNSDGSFVYGWAIAADYCEAAALGIVSVDLFFDTYEETLLFGKHLMNIYVVKQLYRDELQQYVARQGYFDSRVPGRP